MKEHAEQNLTLGALTHIHIERFLLDDNRLDWESRILAAFFHSMYCAKKTIYASNQYLSLIAKLEIRYVQIRLSRLEELGYIKRETYKNKRIIRWVDKNDSYIINEEVSKASPQKVIHSEDVSNDTEGMLHATPQACCEQRTDNKEDIKDIKKKKNIIKKEKGCMDSGDDAQENLSIPKNGTANASSDAQDLFEAFWNLYPVKKGKAKARKSWMKQKLDAKFESITEKLKLQIEKDIQWQNKQFIPHGDTYVRNEMWEDEIQLGEVKTVITKEEPSSQTYYAFDLEAQNDMHDRKYGLGKYAGQGRMKDEKREVSQGPKNYGFGDLLKMLPKSRVQNDFKGTTRRL
jgi:hypothetical protein